MSIFFKFHNLLELEIDTKDKRTISFFMQEYQPYLVDQLSGDMPRVFLRFQRAFLPKIIKGYTLYSHKLFANWAYKVKIISDQQIEIDVYGNSLSISLVHHMLLHPSLRYLSSLQGVLMLHSGAVAYGQESWLFTGYGGAGKTTTTSLLLKALGKEGLLHADDYVFFSPEPRTYSYLTRSHLYWDLAKWLPALKKVLSVKELIALWFWGKLRDASREQIKWPVRVGFDRLWQGYEHLREATPAGVIWLEKSYDGTVSLDAFEPDTDELNKLVEMNFYEARHFLALLMKNSSIRGYEQWLDEWILRERELLRECFSKTQSYKLKISHVSKDVTFLAELLNEIRSRAGVDQS